jgi:hypothetical protein
MAWRAILDTVAASETLAELSDFAERLYWRILSKSDPWGRIAGTPAKVRALCVPLLSVTNEQVAQALDELERVGRIERYTVDGVTVLQVTDFEENQPRDVRRGPGRGSKYPPPPSVKSLQIDMPHKTDSDSENESSPSSVSSLRFSLPISREEPKGLRAAIASSVASRDFSFVADELSGSDDRTPAVIAAASRGLSPAELYNAAESLELRRGRPPRLESEVRYFVATLKRIREERSTTAA